MVAGAVCRRATLAVGAVPQDREMINDFTGRNSEGEGNAGERDVGGGEGRGGNLHERLVAYVRAVAGDGEARCGVWMEHSYARARGGPAGAAAGGGALRVLLAPRAPPPAGDEPLDVCTPPPPRPAPPASPADSPAEDDASDGDDDGDGDAPEAADWEARLTAHAPSPAHERLAGAALEALRAARLERLAADGAWARREAARGGARRLRAALAPLAAGGGPAPLRPAAWLHGALLAHLPRALRRLYGALVAELRRAAPRLAERLAAGRAPPPRPRAPSPPARAAGPGGGAWLAWAPSGAASLDARWERRLRPLVHTRVLRGAGPEPGAAPPAAWAASATLAARAALAELLAEAGTRPVVLGGAGAGAALAVSLAGAARGAGVRGLLLLAPPLLTAEGPRDAPDDPLNEIELPMLIVSGTGGAASWRGAAGAAARLGEGGAAGGARRLLLVGGADDALRLPPARRRRLRLPQRALDAAVAEECARFVLEAGELPPAAPPPAAERAGRAARRPPPASPPSPPSPPPPPPPPDEEEYAHLPSPAPAAPAAPAAPPPGSGRAIEIVAEGRGGPRAPGRPPLALPLAPRRSPPAAPLAAADILHMPIVFADDEPSPPPAPPSPGAAGSPVTVTSGNPRAAAGEGRRVLPPGAALQYTRVIVAKRGAAGGGGGGRPVQVQRALRLLARAAPRP